MLQLLQNKDFPYLSCNSYFVQIDDYRIVIDTGNYFLRNELIQSLEMNNIGTEEINFVINTHLHFDHCGNNEIFPNARIILPANELDFIEYINRYDKKASLDYVRETYPLIPEDKLKNFLRMIYAHKKSYDWLLNNSQRTIIIEKDTELFLDVKLIFSHGHSPGHISLLFKKDKVCFSGDIIGNDVNENNGVLNISFVVKNYAQLMESREKLYGLADTFFPGHGDYIRKNGR